jgi:ribosome biogenesis GTPase / thiamine phosphate phosphatase
MNPDLLDRLRPIGCNVLIAQAISQIDSDGSPMRITEVHRDSVAVHDGLSERRAQPLPRLARELSLSGDQLAVGDWVVADTDSHGSHWLTARMAPVSQLARRASDGARQCLVSNVDTALLVMGLDGNHNLRRLERYLAMVQSAGVWPVVVLTKQDLADSAADKIVDLHRRVPPSVPVHAVDARSESAATELRDYLKPGQTLVMLGSSGVGKSTLTNTLLGRAVQAIGAVRADDSRGRHTTAVRSLHRLAGGACVIDTPGLRGLEIDSTEEGLQASFTDVAALARQCRFRDCTHTDEPDCAVRAGVHPDRLANFLKLRREIRRETMTFLDRRRQLAEWKARGRAADLRMKLKRG